MSGPPSGGGADPVQGGRGATGVLQTGGIGPFNSGNGGDTNDWGEDGDYGENGMLSNGGLGGLAGRAIHTNGYTVTWIAGSTSPNVKGTVG